MYYIKMAKTKLTNIA